MSNQQPHKTSDQSLASKLIQGASIMVGGRVFIRLIGLVSVSITARLLTPEDFGVMGAASLVLVFFALFNKIGFEESILRMESEDKSRLDTLWTIRLIIAVMIALLVFLFAPLMADLLQESRIQTVLYLMASTVIITAFHAPAVQILRKRLNFYKENELKVFNKLITVSLVLGFIYVEQTYMGMVYGQVAAAVAGIITSQLYYRYLPRFSLTYIKQELSFSLWTLIRNMSNYASGNADEWAAKRASSTAEFGAYHAAHDLSRLLVSEFLYPIGETFAAGIQTVRHDHERLKRSVMRFLSVVMIMGFPIATGVALTSHEIVFIVLGDQWGAVTPYLPPIAFALLGMVLSDLLFGIYVAMDKQRRSAFVKFARAILITLGSLLALIYGDILFVAQVYCAIALGFVVIEYILLFRLLGLSFYHIPRIMIRPFLASAVMAATLYFTLNLPDDMGLLVAAGVKVSLGVGVYTAVLFILWLLSGKPKSGEQELFTRLMQILKRS